MACKNLVADACATLNVLATERSIQILRAFNCRILEPRRVSGQIQYLWTMPDENGERSREPASTEDLRAVCLLEEVELTTDAERGALVEAAAYIDDCDAACIALAGARGLPLLTDDRKERKLASRLFPHIELLSTLELIRRAGEELGWDVGEFRHVAAMLRWRANYLPPRNAPEADWYAELLTLP